MRALIVSEGTHEQGRENCEGALSILVRRLLDRATDIRQEKVSDRKVRVHLQPGKTPGYQKRALAWMNFAETEGFDAVVIVIDQDKETGRVAQFAKAQADQRLSIPRALGVAIRTIDAWMLADEVALSKALEHTVSTQPAPEGIPDPKQVAADLLAESDRPLSQTKMYSKVSTTADLQRIRERCPKGFDPFAGRVEQIRPDG
jgi:hypothetical protein